MFYRVEAVPFCHFAIVIIAQIATFQIVQANQRQHRFVFDHRLGRDIIASGEIFTLSNRGCRVKSMWGSSAAPGISGIRSQASESETRDSQAPPEYSDWRPARSSNGGSDSIGPPVDVVLD